MGTRIRDEMVVCPPTVIDKTPSGGIVSYVNNRSVGTIGNYQSVTGTDTGRFQPGILRINPCVIYRISKTYKNAELKFLSVSMPKCILTGPCEAYRTDMRAAPFNSSLADQSLTKAYSKIGKSVIDVGMTLAELPETLGMIKNGFTKLIDVYDRFGAPKSKLYQSLGRIQDLIKSEGLRSASDVIVRLAKEKSSSLSNAYLTYRYGIRPLIGEITSYIQYFNGLSGGLKHGSFVRSRGKAETTVSTERQIVDQGGYASVYLSYTESYEAVISSYSGIYFSLIRVGEFYNFMERYGVAPHHMPSLAWELIPLSFVVDWFIDVGSWIRAITPIPDARILGSYTSQKTIETRRRKYTSAKYYGRSPSDPTWPEDEQVTETLRRVTGQNLPAMPSFNWGITLTLAQYVDLFTLAVQRLK